MKAFFDIIRRVDRGQMNRDIEKAMDEIAQAIELNGGTGKITVTIEMKRKGDAYQFSGKMEHKVPQKPRLDAIMFYDPDAGEFVGRDPRQPEFEEVAKVESLNRHREDQQQSQ